MNIFSKLNQNEQSDLKPAKLSYIIVGLGNPGLAYQNTRHNAGFMTIDVLADKLGVKIDRIKYKSRCCDTIINGKRVLLMKPETYMNNSGEAVAEAASFYKIKPQNIIVLFDDISLEPGKMRIRRKGTHGGHNGIKSIIELTGSEDIPRIKIGVGKKPHPDYDLAKWVLSRLSDEDLKAMQPCFENAAEACELILSGKIDDAMSRFNS